MGCHRYSLMECDGLDDDSDDICDCFPGDRLAISSVACFCVAAEWGVA